MKEGIHPSYNEKIKATCSCGATFEVGSTAESLKVEVCSECHPFYTGKQKLVDAAGRINKFKKRLEEADKLGNDKPKSKKTKKKTGKEDNEVKL